MDESACQRIERPEFTVVMPVFDEEEVIASTVNDLIGALEGEGAYEVLLVDDGSTDSTWERICELAGRHPQVKGLRFTRNFGHQSALRAGLVHAAGDAVITMDADGEHPPLLVPAMLARWRAGARVVQGVRAESKRLSLFKRLSSRGFYRVFSWLSQTRVHPGTADFRLLDRSVVDLLNEHPNASGFLRGFIPWSGFATEYLEFEQGRRIAGRSRFTTGRMVELARRGIIGSSVKPLRLSMMLGLITCAFALASLVYAVVMRICAPESVVPGWATLTGLLSLLGGVQLLVLGILGEYVAVLFQAIRNQPEFIIDERRGFAGRKSGKPGSGCR